MDAPVFIRGFAAWKRAINPKRPGQSEADQPLGEIFAPEGGDKSVDPLVSTVTSGVDECGVDGERESKRGGGFVGRRLAHPWPL
jgi:hypothetical protein